MNTMQENAIAENIRHIRDRVAEAAAKYGRDPRSVTLIAVTKTKDAKTVQQALDAGITDVGENYIQEAKDKIEAIGRKAARWHFIGHLQSNKARYAARLFDMIHTLDSEKLAEALNHRLEVENRTMDALLQVNLAGEKTKSGVPPETVPDLARAVAAFPRLRVRGLMTMPPFFDDPDRARPYFSQLCDLANRIKEQNIPHVQMDELSMGMTGDFEAAIAEGATLVRIGTALFGPRIY